jgi:hypothetical protein
MKAWFLLAKVRDDYKPIVVNGRDLDADADIEDVVAETDYSFKHPNILDTDWFDVSEVE